MAFFGEGTVSDDIRLNVPGQILKSRGYKLIEQTEQDEQGNMVIDDSFNIAVFSRPHSPNVIATLKKSGKKIIIDQDDDFWNIPKSHVGYMGIGPGNPAMINKLNASLALADVITTSSVVLANLLHMLIPDRPIVILWNGWDDTNEFWYAPKPKIKDSDQYINIGWAGTITHREDFQQCNEAVTKILKTHDNTRIVIGQDLEIYNMFSQFPETRKLYLPPVPYSLYPTMVSHFDILIAPLDNIQFNHAKSDIKMVDAGCRKIPYVASELPAYIRWNAEYGGGYLANNPQEWYSALDRLVQSKTERNTLGEEGWLAVQDRRQEKLVDTWEKLLGELHANSQIARTNE
jgi:hypothetical protein